MLPLLERLGWWGIDFHLPSGVLLLAVMLCSIRVRQPARRRAIGGAAAIGLLLLALLTVLPGWPRMAWRQAPPRHALPQIFQLPSAGAASEPLTVNRSAMRKWNNHELAAAPGQPLIATDVPQAPQAVPPSARPQPSAVTPTAANPVDWPALAGAFILVGAAWAGIWLLLGTVQAARIRRGAQAAGPELSRVFDRVVGAPRHKPQLLVSGDTTLPLAMGLFRPAIVLPQSCASTSPGVEVEAAIAHEWAHVRHGDLWLLALLRLLLPLFACQPLFWWLRKTIRTAQEELADAAASDRGGRVAYAEVLLAWARTSPAVLPRGLDGSLALWERPSQLKRRVLTLLDRRFHVELCCSRRRRLAITAATLTIAGLLSIPTLRPAISADDENAAVDATPSDTGAEPAARKTPETSSAKAPNKSSDETGTALADAKQPPPAAVNIAVTRGRVLTPEGKPLSGAKLFLSYPNVAKVQPQLLGESGADGRFEFRVDTSQLDTSYTPDPWSAAALTAVADGFGFEWVETNKTDADGNLTIKLLEDVPIHGRILTLEGRPVVGATVKLSTVSAPDGGLDDYIKELRGGLTGDRALHSSRLGRSSFPGMRDTAVTDAAGRFTLSGIGAERIVQMLVTSDDVEHVFLRALTREIDPIEPPQIGPGVWGATKIYGATFEFLARPSRKIVGTVRERGGQPLPGISLRSFSGAGLTATTDAQGRYELIGHPKAQRYQVRVMPENMPYFGTMLNIADTPGLDPIVADIELSRGIAVQGHVTAGPNGEPNEATVEYYPLFGNTHVEGIGRFGGQAAASAKCDADGRYTIPVLPGPGLLAFKYGPWYRQAVARDYMPAWLDQEKVDELYRSLDIEQPEINEGNVLWTATGTPTLGVINAGMFNEVILVNPREDEASLARDVQFELGRTLAVTVETPDGKPPVGLSIRGRTNMQFVRETFDAPEFTVTGLHPKIDRELIVEAPAEKLAAYRLIHAGETDPIVLRLEPYGAVAGRLLDDDGEPLANTTLGIGKARTMPPEFSATTDKDGKFHLDGLVPGLAYGISLRRQGQQMGMGMIQLAMNVVVEPGKTTDLGDLDLKPKAMAAPGGFRRPPGGVAPPRPGAKPPADQEK